jgi:hypothetical protein
MLRKKLEKDFNLDRLGAFEPADDVARKYLKKFYDSLYVELVELELLLFTLFMRLDEKARQDIENLLSWMSDGFAKSVATQWFRIAQKEKLTKSEQE